MEYVPKKEVKEHNKTFYDIICEVRPKMREEGITFEYRLVGSAKRNLVVWHHNQGFDCDYQIIIRKNKKELNAESINDKFIEKFDESVVDRGFKNCEDSHRAITIKKIDHENSKILKAYDVVILDERDDGFYIIDNDKDKKKGEKGKYKFEKLPDTRNHTENAKKIKGSEMWSYLRERYLYKKENNTEDLESFQIFNSSVNETMDKFSLE